MPITAGVTLPVINGRKALSESEGDGPNEEEHSYAKEAETNYKWALPRMYRDETGWGHWLPMRRPIGARYEWACYRVFAPANIPTGTDGSGGRQALGSGGGHVCLQCHTGKLLASDAQ